MSSPFGNHDKGPDNAHSDQLVEVEDDSEDPEGYNAEVAGEVAFGFSRGNSSYFEGLPETIGSVVIPPPEVMVY